MAPEPAKKPKPFVPSNAKPVTEYTLDELKKTAASRGITVEKLVAQMVQQYLAEDKKPEE